MSKIVHQNFTAKNISIFITIVVFCLYVLPFILLQDSTYIHVHDNLDCVFLWHHLLVTSRNLFTFNMDITFENVMNGLPIWSLPTSFFTGLLLYIFGPLAGYIVNDIVVRIVGFIGMYLLLKEYLIKGVEKQYIVITLALCFALIPFDSIYGTSVSGQSLLLYAFLNILNRKQNIYSYIMIAFFAFYEFFALAGIFMICVLGIILAADTIKNRKFNYYFFVWMIIFTALCFVAEYRLMYGTFFAKGYVPHRVEWDFTVLLRLDFESNIKRAQSLLQETHYHTGSFNTYVIRLAFMGALVFAWWNHRLKPILFWLPLAIVSVCLICGFYHFLAWSVGLGNFIPFLKTFQGDRFYYLLPLLWFLLFAVSLNEISEFKKFNYIIYGLLILHLIWIGTYNEEYQQNFRQLFAAESEQKLPNFKQFFADSLFLQIKNYIDTSPENYRVISIGMHPSIAQYNGFYTLDSYQNTYPLEYKHKFRQIIDKELKKDQGLRNYFDAWGSRCYVFSAELRNKCYVMCSKYKNDTIDKLEIDINALKALGGQYIFSAVPINNFEDLNLTFEKTFEDQDAYWSIYLYKVN